MKNGVLAAIGLAGVALIGIQFKSVADLRKEVARLRADLAGIESAPATPGESREASARPQVSLGSLPQRVAQLEQSIADLSKTTDFLVERGIMPPSAERVEQMQARFFDPNAPDRDRLRALSMIKRNGGMTDDVAAQAVGWLQSATNANTRRGLLRELDGLTNSSMKQPLLGMLGSETNRMVREQLVDVLADFVSDPAVEQQFWNLALNDPNNDVRQEAREALTEGQMTPERVESLKQKAADTQLSLDARLIALRGLGQANASAPEVIAELAQLAQTSTDPVTRAKLFDAFNDIRDPSLAVPLVHGLQDPNPVVRERAAHALSAFNSNEQVQQWLNHVIQNDTDPRVKREAFRALEQAQRERERGGRQRFEGPPRRAFRGQ